MDTIIWKSILMVLLMPFISIIPRLYSIPQCLILPVYWVSIPRHCRLHVHVRVHVLPHLWYYQRGMRTHPHVAYMDNVVMLSVASAGTPFAFACQVAHVALRQRTSLV